MKIILSTEVAKKLRIERQVINEFVPDINTWRISSAALLKRSVFIISNEITLYTLISSYKNGFKGIIEKLEDFCGDEKINASNIDYIKFQNRSVTGSMNNIKQIIKNVDKYEPQSTNEFYEHLINQTLFKYLSDKTPAQVHDSRTF